jgi:hypothetical protein
MGIETFFFISLAVTFILLVCLVYHFRQKFTGLDQRVNHVIEIINSVVKEMQNLKGGLQGMELRCGLQEKECIQIPCHSFIQTPVNSEEDHLGNVPTDVFELTEGVEGLESDDDDEDDYEDDYDDEDSELDDKIVVSDDEEDDIVIESEMLEETLDENTLEERKKTELAKTELGKLTETKDLEVEDISIISNTDYKKMDIQQLRAIALVKGIDAKKMKKAELLKLLEE